MRQINTLETSHPDGTRAKRLVGMVMTNPPVKRKNIGRATIINQDMIESRVISRDRLLLPKVASRKVIFRNRLLLPKMASRKVISRDFLLLPKMASRKVISRDLLLLPKEIGNSNGNNPGSWSRLPSGFFGREKGPTFRSCAPD
ncbi:hypothetical protein [Desulfobacca acetoxidans]|uniref:hypothetical protein n=1 Tax=Desulfobacca acetoxidans TaxID=60893 RepID=UPI0003173D6A|nr:hypothetical protein [Desulfobacca acetoxidans]